MSRSLNIEDPLTFKCLSLPLNGGSRRVAKGVFSPSRVQLFSPPKIKHWIHHCFHSQVPFGICFNYLGLQSYWYIQSHSNGSKQIFPIHNYYLLSLINFNVNVHNTRHSCLFYTTHISLCYTLNFSINIL